MKKVKFYDEQHKQFYEQKLKEIEELREVNIYDKSIIYILGLCNITRDNFENIFDLKNGITKDEALEGEYQTEDSIMITRFAISIFNSKEYSNDYDFVRQEMFKYYNSIDLFVNDYGTYFYQILKFRFADKNIK